MYVFRASICTWCLAQRQLDTLPVFPLPSDFGGLCDQDRLVAQGKLIYTILQLPYLNLQGSQNRFGTGRRSLNLL